MKPSFDDGWCKLYTADAVEALRAMPEKSVHMCVTSPPYFGLRSYLLAGHPDKAKEGGTQKTPQEYVAWLVEVMREVRRVLRDDGTLWLNLGDSYASSGAPGDTRSGFNERYHGKEYATDKQAEHGANYASVKRTVPQGLKPKDLMMIPARAAIALQEDGWTLRADIIWAKANCMPESVTDRPTRSHEHLFLLSKSPRYFYDAEAVKEQSDHPNLVGKSQKINYSDNSVTNRQDGDRVKVRTATRNKRDVWHVNPQNVTLRSDLTDEQRTYVVGELLRRGLL